MNLNIIKGCLLFPFLMGLLSCSSSVTTLVLQDDDPLQKPSQSNKVMVKYSLQANIQFSLSGKEDKSLQINTVSNETCEELLSNNPTIESCELDPYVKLVENNNLWGFQNTNISEITTIKSNENIIIAVIDTGVDISHPALRNNIWVNEDEIPGNGIDDDNNGYIDDIHGWDFANNDASVFDPGDGDTHGTHVAGIISSIIGDNPLRKIMVLKFINRQGGTLSGAINALKYAINNGAKLSNNSYGSYYYSSFFEEAIEFSRHHNHLLIAAAGNDSRTDLFYPASFEHHNIISVAASNANHQLAYFSNRGIPHVDIAAPGNAIYSTLPGGQYGLMSGTSMASPLIAGVVGLGMSLSSQLSLNQLKDTLLETSTQRNAFIGQVNSNGIVNAADFLSSLASQTPQAETTPKHSDRPEICKEFRF